MDKYKNVERRLRNLEMEKTYLIYLEKDLKLLELEYEISGINYEKVGGNNNISDITGDKAVKLMQKRQELELKIARKKNEIEHIEGVLSKLTETERKIITMWYIEYKPHWKIAQEVGYSVSQVKRIKKDAIEKIMVGLYGDEDRE